MKKVPPRAAAARGRSGGVGRPASREGEHLSDELRLGAAQALTGRRRVAGLSLASIGSLGVVAAYQFGLLRHVPEPPLAVFDADRVDASGEAYGFLLTPDATMGMANAAITLVLAGMGRADRSARSPWVPIALAVKVGLDAGAAGFLTVEQVSKHRKLCAWCLLSAAASFAMVPAVAPEARAALRSLRSR